MFSGIHRGRFKRHFTVLERVGGHMNFICFYFPWTSLLCHHIMPYFFHSALHDNVLLVLSLCSPNFVLVPPLHDCAKYIFKIFEVFLMLSKVLVSYALHQFLPISLDLFFRCINFSSFALLFFFSVHKKNFRSRKLWDLFEI